MRWIYSMLAVALLVTAACGDDDGSSPGGGGGAAETTEVTATPSPEERAAIEAAVLRLSDFPSGWTQETAEDDDDAEEDEQDERAIAECIGVDYERLYGGDTRADSPTFVGPDESELSSSAGIRPSEEDAQFRFDTLDTDEALGCIAEQLQVLVERNAAGEDVEVGEIALDRLSFGQFGDETNAYRITMPLAAQGMEIDVYIDIATVRVGRAGVNVQAFSLFTPYDTAELERYTEILADRLAASLADAGIE